MPAPQPITPTAQAQGFEQFIVRAGAVEKNPLGLPFGIFGRRRRIHDDAAADAALGNAALGIHHRRADADAEHSFAAGFDEADGAAINAARRGFETRNGRHRRRLWRAGHRAAGKQRGEHLAQRGVVAAAAGDGGGHLPNRRPLLDRKQLGHGHRAEARHARKIVANQIDDHHIFGAFLGRLAQAQRGGIVPLRVLVAGRRALHRSRDQRPPIAVIVLPMEKQFRRNGAYLPASEIEIGAPRRRLALPQGVVERQAVAAKRRPQARRVIDLVKLALGDAVADGGHGGGEVIAPGNVAPWAAHPVRALSRGGRRAAIYGEHRRRQASHRIARRQRRVESAGCFVGDKASHPAAFAGFGFGLGQHLRHLVNAVGDKQNFRRGKCRTQAFRPVGEVDFAVAVSHANSDGKVQMITTENTEGTEGLPKMLSPCSLCPPW